MKSIADKFDFSLVVIWFIALANITLGAFWTNYEFAKRSDLTPLIGYLAVF